MVVKEEPQLPQYLYHGTRLSLMDVIMENGIRPRGKRKSNWERFVSNRERIYLTSCYPFYFAHHAAVENEVEDDALIVLEIDTKQLDIRLFYPDEDYIAQAMRKISQTNEIGKSIEMFKIYWLKSLLGMGTCSYKGVIPFEAINRICKFEPKENPHLWITICDPSISIMNYQLLGNYYKGLVAWFFEDLELIPHKTASFNVDGNEEGNAEFLKHEKIREEFWKQLSKDRKGVTVYQQGDFDLC